MIPSRAGRGARLAALVAGGIAVATATLTVVLVLGVIAALALISWVGI